MARKSGPRQLKRAPAPPFWPLHRKDAAWAPMTRPGPHPRNRSLPLVLVAREILGYARTTKEAIRIISGAKVKVDHVARTDHRFPVGLMDIIQIEGLNQAFRVLPKRGGGLALSPVQEREVGYKLCRIRGKRTVRKGLVQINLHDGRNLIVNVKEGQKAEEAEVGGSIQLTLPAQKIVRYIPLRDGSIGLVTQGKNQGLYGKITKITPGSSARPGMARIETVGEAFETPSHYIMPVGTDAPLLTLDR